MSLIASILVSLGLMLGLSVSPSQPLTQPVSVTCEEDMPCWDSATMGQQLPALTDSELDAWEAVSTLGITAKPNQALEYVESLNYYPRYLTVGQFVVSSKTQPQVFHVMEWVTIHYA